MYLNDCMRIPKRSKDSVEELAKRFTDNSPPLCRDHSPEGLPIDAPEGIDVSENHASYKFETIVEDTAELKDGEPQVVRSRVRSKLREIFAKEFYSESSERSCIQCFEERKDSDEDVPIRMELPDDWSKN